MRILSRSKILVFFFDHKITIVEICSIVSNCGGITYGSYGLADGTEEWTLRSGTMPMPSPSGETSLIRACFGKYYLLGVTLYKASINIRSKLRF